MVHRRFPGHFGGLDDFRWAVTREDARAALLHFIEYSLPWFGDFQDAMKTGEDFLFHSILSPYLNLGLLDPREVCEAAIRTYREGDSPEKDLFKKISPRQREILQLLAEGKSGKEIASVLNISPRTVEFHKYRMMAQLKIKTSAELVQYAVKHRIISV